MHCSDICASQLTPPTICTKQIKWLAEAEKYVFFFSCVCVCQRIDRLVNFRNKPFNMIKCCFLCVLCICGSLAYLKWNATRAICSMAICHLIISITIKLKPINCYHIESILGVFEGFFNRARFDYVTNCTSGSKCILYQLARDACQWCKTCECQNLFFLVVSIG